MIKRYISHKEIRKLKCFIRYKVFMGDFIT